MTKEEIAMQFTLKAFDLDKLALKPNPGDTAEVIHEKIQRFNAKQVHEFYNKILENLSAAAD